MAEMRAQAEADAVVGRDRLLEESDLPKLAYLQAVCKEALRLHPSTPLSLPHFSYEECEVDGYRIPSNSRLLVNIWAIGRDPKVWADPLVFDPDRFVAGGEEPSTTPRQRLRVHPSELGEGSAREADGHGVCAVHVGRLGALLRLETS
ncbi:Cytochrome P450 [Musa troglodytarum]|uniref:Cytochrome P450 n=1 Tax=Musa troglodytarum TaxID=320322 RepID=A0A9E7IM45_9LILI|nr:Cytochrome P450 [Musa troglodytarum]